MNSIQSFSNIAYYNSRILFKIKQLKTDALIMNYVYWKQATLITRLCFLSK